MPHRELADGMLILVGGTLMLTPGFVTDIFGHPVHPAVHPSDRPPLAGRGDQPPPGRGRRTRRRAQRGPGAAQAGRTRQRPGPDDPDDGVVQGEVVD